MPRDTGLFTGAGHGDAPRPRCDGGAVMSVKGVLRREVSKHCVIPVVVATALFGSGRYLEGTAYLLMGVALEVMPDESWRSWGRIRLTLVTGCIGVGMVLIALSWLS